MAMAMGGPTRGETVSPVVHEGVEIAVGHHLVDDAELLERLLGIDDLVIAKKAVGQSSLASSCRPMPKPAWEDPGECRRSPR